MDRPAQLAKVRSQRVPHPRSPAAKTFDWSAISFFHPDAPAARYVHGLASHPDSPSGRLSLADPGSAGLLNSNDPAEDQGTLSRQALEASLDQQVGNLRDTLPDIGLQVIYDRQTRFLKEAYEFTRSFALADPGGVLRHVQRHIGWMHCHLQGTFTQSYGTAARPILEQLESLRAQSLFGDEEQLLRNLQALSERYYKVAAGSIQEHLAEAGQSGKERELILRWRARMLACASQASAAVIEPPPAPARKPPKKSESSETPVKTWIAIQLVDQNGNPVPGVAYEVTLTDGSLMTGSLDSEGSVRFDDIDPGQCQVTFPEIHAKEWKRL